MDEHRLESLPLFAALNKRERREVARWADEVDVSEGRELVKEGDFSYEFFVIVEGTAEVRVGGRPMATLGAGDFFGEMGLLDHVQRQASVVTTSPLTAMVMTGGAFRQMTHELRDVGQKIRTAVEERCRELVE